MIKFDAGTLIALIPEGGAEAAICNLLLDHHLLVFERDQLLEHRPLIGVRNADQFTDRYLKFAFDKKITVLRILDSRREAFRLKMPYSEKVQVINLITAPEIEMLVIISLGKYSSFKKAKKKPSEYCKADLKLRNVKSPEFILNHFEDIDVLVKALAEYRRLQHSSHRDELSLFDLLKIGD